MKRNLIIILSLAVLIIISLLIAIVLFNKNLKIDKSILKNSIIENVVEKKVANDNQDENIFKVVEMQSNYAIDPMNPINLIDQKSVLLKIKVNKIGDAKFIFKNGSFGNPYIPFSPMTVDVLQDYSKKNVQLNNNILYVEGGKIKITEYEKSIDDVDKSRMGIDKMTNEEKNHKYIKYAFPETYNFEVGKEYIVIAKEIANGTYVVLNGGYSVFEPKLISERSLNTFDLKNVMTKKEFSSMELLEKINK